MSLTHVEYYHGNFLPWSFTFFVKTSHFSQCLQVCQLHLRWVQFSSVAQSCLTLRPHGLQHTRPLCPSPTPRAYSNSCALSQWCRPAILSSGLPFASRLQSFPASGPFQMSWLFSSGGQSIRVSASASVLPVNIQDWFPLGWTGWILQSKRLSRVFSNTRVQKHQFFETQLSLWFSLTSIHDYWKNHSFDYTDLCQWSNISAF